MKILPFVSGVVVGIGVCAAAWAVMWSGDDNARLEEENIAVAIEFYDRLLNQLDFDNARELMGENYIQHNPRARDGFEGVKAHIDMLKRDFPLNHGDIKRVFANGNLVALHVHSKRYPEHRGNAIVDIFRIENGKVVEHWDVVQAVPETALNDNTMF